MDPKEIFKVLHDATMASAKAPRGLQREALQRGIEDAIAELRPDAIEAEEIISALAAALQKRFPEASTEVLLRMSLLKGDLERMEKNEYVDASDVLAAYERATERRRP